MTTTKRRTNSNCTEDNPTGSSSGSILTQILNVGIEVVSEVVSFLTGGAFHIYSELPGGENVGRTSFSQAITSIFGNHGGKESWEEGFRRLLEYVKRKGHARVPRSYTVDGYKLGGWVSTQRSFYARGTLDAERQHRLGDLPGWTWRASSSST